MVAKLSPRPTNQDRIRRSVRLGLIVCVFAPAVLSGACIFGGSSDQGESPVPALPAADSVHSTGGSAPSSAATPPTSRSQGVGSGLASVVITAPFVWPAEGPVTSLMGPDHPDGIDIGLDAGGSLTIRASAAGTVASAGGSDDETLGISIVIDHGNGVTTTYGHLSEAVVEAGQAVAAGEVIGVGGSTGVSTGDHLHFEVRRHGATVDPLDVLLDERVDSRLSAVDCELAPIFAPLGSSVTVDFREMVGDAGRIESARALPLNEGPTLRVSVEGRNVVHLSSAIDFQGPDGEDQYNIAITLDGANENRVLSCPFIVQRQSVPTTFYARAVPDDGDTEAAAEEMPPSPTATPNPWPQGPDYGVPLAPGSSAQSPVYTSPVGSGVVVQSPAYGFPPSAATPVAP